MAFVRQVRGCFMLGFIHSIFDYLVYAIGSLAGYIDMLHLIFLCFFSALSMSLVRIMSLWAIPLPLKAMALVFSLLL